MFALGLFAPPDAVVRGRFTNVFQMGSSIFNASGTTGSLSPTAGPANANRYIFGYIGHNNSVAMTIGGVTATMVSTGMSSQSFFYAAVPTGTAPTIALSGLTNGGLVRMAIFSAEMTSAPTLTVPTTTMSTTGAITGTIPTNGFAVGWSIASASSAPTGPTIAAGFGALSAAGPVTNTALNYMFASDLSDVGASGSVTTTFTWTGATTINTNMMLVA